MVYGQLYTCKLKILHSEVFTTIHWGRLMVFLYFAEKLELTEEEWEQLFDFLVPILTQIVDVQFGLILSRA